MRKSRGMRERERRGEGRKTIFRSRRGDNNEHLQQEREQEREREGAKERQRALSHCAYAVWPMRESNETPPKSKMASPGKRWPVGEHYADLALAALGAACSSSASSAAKGHSGKLSCRRCPAVL